MLLSVDPGVHYHGLALWEDGELTAAWLSAKDCESVADEIAGYYAPLDVVDSLVIEVPQIYSISKSKGGIKGQNDLLKLAFAAGDLTGHLAHYGIALTNRYSPREWKGSVPKDIMVERIKYKLSPDERARVNLPRAESRHHNVWDGIGVGLKFWRRL